ncbi:transposable element Tcb2 transposase [Trichonephila clavipes]|nr:transposable element Tcb2 transposase [Trichonephila clavipes]
MPLRHFRRQYEQLSQYERGRIIGMMEAGWSARRVARQLCRSDCVWCRGQGNWTAAEWNQVVFSDESRFNLSSAFALQRHAAPTAGRMVWGATAYNTRSSLVLIHSPMTAQHYVHNILQPHVLPLMQWLHGAIFQQDNARPHTARVSKDYLRIVTTLPWPARSLNLSPIGHIWDHLGRRVGHPTSLNELEKQHDKHKRPVTCLIHWGNLTTICLRRQNFVCTLPEKFRYPMGHVKAQSRNEWEFKDISKQV